jgi:nondiscriminating aspartyl-tRNA synthetase
LLVLFCSEFIESIVHMMRRTVVSDTPKKVGKQVNLLGWVNRRRDYGKLVFIDLRDRSGVVQIVAGEEAGDVRDEYVVKVEGVVRKRSRETVNPNLKTGRVEVKAKRIEVLSVADDLPIPVVEKGKTRTSLTKRLSWRWVDLRKPRNLLIFKIWTEMEAAMREFWLKHGFIQIYTPKLMSAPSESGSELFEVKYFGRKAYLAQSPQFYKQMAMAAGLERVFEIGPVFRANPSFTSRHDTEFTMIDAEISFIKSHEDVMESLEKLVTFVIKSVKNRFGDEIESTFGRELVVPKLPFPRVTMKEAKAFLNKVGKKSAKVDLSPGEERALGKIVNKKYNHEFVFVTEYPWEERPFYHMRKEENQDLTKSFDLLWGGLEIVTGAQREHRHEILRRQALEKGLTLGPIKHYLDFFRFGCPPHGGFGLGPTRMLMQMLDIKNVREVTYLYRGVKRLTP